MKNTKPARSPTWWSNGRQKGGNFCRHGFGSAGSDRVSVRYLSLVTAGVMVILIFLSLYAGRVFARKTGSVETPRLAVREVHYRTAS